MQLEILIVVGVLLIATALGLLWRSRNGRLRQVSGEETTVPFPEEHLSGGFAARLTFVQFSSEVCAPCRATARVLRALAADEADVAHHELDVAEHQELTRRLRVVRTPTVFVLNSSGHIVGRMSGAVTATQARETLAVSAVAASSA